MNSTRRAIATWMLLSQRSYSTTTALIHNTRKYTPLSATQLIMNPLATWRTDRIPSSQLSYSSSAALMINNDSDSSSGSSSDDGPSPPQAQPPPFPIVEIPHAYFKNAAISNVVELHGYLDFPVVSSASSSGNFWSGTIIRSNVDEYTRLHLSLPLWMPLLFQNHWAWTAATQLKINDKIFVIGQAVNFNANPPVPACAPLCRGNFQVLADAFAIIEKSTMEEETLKHSGDESSWKHLLANPGEWKDHRLDKKDKEDPDFLHQTTRNALWLSSSPDWVKSVLPLIPPVNFRHTDARNPIRCGSWSKDYYVY